MATAVRSKKLNEESAVEMVLEQVFGNSELSWDLAEGTVRGFKEVRVIYLSEDIIRGIYEALLHETGEAWSMILQTAGLTWGRRTTKLLDLQVEDIAPNGLTKLSVNDYFKLLQTYYQLHGWGLANFDLSRARSNGVIRVTLDDSIFVHSLSDLAEPVDHMIGGMLTGMFEIMSKRSLGFAEVASPLLGAPSTEFLITAPRRIEEIMPLIEDRLPADEICEHLCS